MNAELINATIELVNVNLDANLDFTLHDFVTRVIDEHQNRYPGSWQDWNVSKKSKSIAALVNKAIKNKEYSPARAVELFA